MSKDSGKKWTQIQVSYQPWQTDWLYNSCPENGQFPDRWTQTGKNGKSGQSHLNSWMMETSLCIMMRYSKAQLVNAPSWLRQKLDAIALPCPALNLTSTSFYVILMYISPNFWLIIDIKQTKKKSVARERVMDAAERLFDLCCARVRKLEQEGAANA